MIQSVEKVVRILQALDSHDDWIGVRELARKVGLPAPTTHNLLKTLRAVSFVETHPATKQYRLGLAAIRLGHGRDPLNQIRIFARPYIEALAHELDETIVVLTWIKDDAVVVDWIQADYPLGATHNHGVVEHPIIFASGRALLAYQDRATQARYAARENLAQCGPNSPLTTEDMFELLDSIARDGYAITMNVANTGLAAVAAPVFDANGKILFTVGWSAPLFRTTEAQIELMKNRLVEVTSMMTAKLGGGRSGRREISAA